MISSRSVSSPRLGSLRQPPSLSCTAFLSSALFAALLLTGVPCQGAAFDEGLASFAVKVRGDRIPYRVFALFVAPSEVLTFEVQNDDEGAGKVPFNIETNGGKLTQFGAGQWRWSAPPLPAQRISLVIRKAGGDPSDTMRLELLTTTSLAEAGDGHLEGYRIGSYPLKALRGLEVYRPPAGLFRVEPDMTGLQVSPHFTLGQFLCKQEGGFPKFLVLRQRLLLKLEYLLKLVNEKGIRTDSFFVMSGFRTPFYNHAIGNVEFSRHQWGGAADIFVDVAPADGVMDDLDGNGRIDERDADFLYDLFDGQLGRPEYESLIGGLGKYGPTSNHGPFVHVDARGFQARWGR